MFRQRADEIQAQVEAEKAWWQKRRAGIRTEFMKELDDEKTPAKTASEDEPVLVGADTPSAPGSTKKNKGKK